MVCLSSFRLTYANIVFLLKFCDKPLTFDNLTVCQNVLIGEFVLCQSIVGEDALNERCATFFAYGAILQ